MLTQQTCDLHDGHDNRLADKTDVLGIVRAPQPFTASVTQPAI
jgi:hypothetical protein